MDVAKEAQVSIATASRVLNGSTRKVRNQSYVKVMEAATKLNYRPNAYAQAVAKGTAPNIVLLVSDISDPYFASVSQGVVKAAAERGISVTIGVAATPHEELEAVRKSVSTRPRGIIISESEYTDAPERQALQTELTQYEASGGRAVFVLNRNLPFPAVDMANDVGARAIAKLIVDSGYTRPAILKGDDAHRSSKERLAGVMEVLDEAGITVDPKAVANGKFSRTDGYAAVMQMARSGLLKPGEGALYDGKGIDSIIALNDVMAMAKDLIGMYYSTYESLFMLVVAALVTLDLADANKWLESQGAKPEPDLASLAKNAIVHAEVERAVNAANEGVSRAESIRKFEILPDEFTEANGMLTPSLKTRRAQIVEHYRELIDNVIYVPLKK